MITCRELIDFLGAYLDGELSPAERAAFDEHYAACPACQAYVASYRQTIQLSRAAMADAGAEVAPPPMPEDLVRAILAARSKAQP